MLRSQLISVHPELRIFVQDHVSGVAFRRRRKACEKINHRRIFEIPRIYPPQEDKFSSITQRLVRLRRIGQKDHLWMDTNKNLVTYKISSRGPSQSKSN
jgi:hypothetical protein